MATAGSGAVFFLGTRAHYQVLQQPESRFDVENGNSTETIYQNPSVQWSEKVDNYINGKYCCEDTVPEDKDSGLKRRNRRPSETALCEDMKPAALNDVESATPKSKSRRSLLAYLTSIRRKKKMPLEHQYLAHIHSALTHCTYRESCRCLDCQSRYFECDEDEEDYSSEDDGEYLHYLSLAMRPPPPPQDDDDDDEVFVEQPPEDNTSTDLLLEEPQKMSVSTAGDEDADNMNLEVAAGTPVLLNYLLTHPPTEVNTSTDLLLEEPQKMSVSTAGDEDADNMNLEVAAGTPVLLNYLLTHPVTCVVQ